MKLQIGQTKQNKKSDFYIELKEKENVFISCPANSGIRNHSLSLFSSLLKENDIKSSITISNANPIHSFNHFYDFLELYDMEDKFELIDFTLISNVISHKEITKLVNHYLNNEKHIIIIIPNCIRGNFNDFLMQIIADLKKRDNPTPIIMEDVSNLIFQDIELYYDFTEYLNSKKFFFIDFVINLPLTFFSNTTVKKLSCNKHFISIGCYKNPSFTFSYLYNDKTLIPKNNLFIREEFDTYGSPKSKGNSKIKLIESEILKANILEF
jgi:hypothetical protein